MLTSVAQPPPVLGPPLRNGPWLAVYEPSWERGHRRVLYTVNDSTRLPGRFAIDFMLLSSQGQMAHHNADSVKNWYGYGAEVLAVANGVVVSMRNDLPESATISANPKLPPEKGSGNYIALDIGDRRYVFYEHLKPGSISVKIGQVVTKGQPIARLGFTGHTVGPHLHLHVADRNSSLGAEGLPFAFAKFKTLGSYPNPLGLGAQPWVPVDKPLTKTLQRPAPNSVISFPQ